MGKMINKYFIVVLAMGMLGSSLVGCTSSTDSEKSDKVTTTNPVEETGKTEEQAQVSQIITPETTAEIDIMVWSGDGVYHEDLGSKEWAPEDITAHNVAAIYAVAKEFNKTYPNIKINLYAKVGDPNGNDISWAQERENFKAEHGKYPDIYASTDLVGDVSKGLVADLSVYQNDPMYQSFNESIMEMLNYYGIQAGLPQYLLPWGVYVNKELAEQNNIDIPEPNWTIDDYTEFVSQGNNKEFFGGMDAPMRFINTGTKDTYYRIAKGEVTDGKYIDLTTEAVADLLEYVPEWSKSAVWAANDDGLVTPEFMDQFGWWGYNFFAGNTLLTYDSDPWMLGSAAMPPETPGAVQSNDWDIYPRPSTPYQENTVGIVIDPIAIHNYSMDDGDPNWSDTEKEQLDAAYAFTSYWIGDTQAMQARAEQMYSSNGVLQSALNDSFPLVTGEAFDEQMEIWYSTENHKRYQDTELMPGFQEVIRIWEEGKIWDISDKTHIYYIEEDGQRIPCLNEWDNAVNPAVVGFKKTDPAWLDNIKANLSDWTELMNGRFVKAEETLKQGLTDYYGITEFK